MEFSQSLRVIHLMDTPHMLVLDSNGSIVASYTPMPYQTKNGVTIFYYFEFYPTKDSGILANPAMEYIWKLWQMYLLS